MTTLLDKAFAEASKLPIKQQADLAARILAELSTRQHARARYAERGVVAGMAAQGLAMDEEQLKDIVKPAILELLQEQGDQVRELLAQIAKDVAAP